jgi:hypothetical protein
MYGYVVGFINLVCVLRESSKYIAAFEFDLVEQHRLAD